MTPTNEPARRRRWTPGRVSAYQSWNWPEAEPGPVVLLRYVHGPLVPMRPDEARVLRDNLTRALEEVEGGTP